MAEIPRYRGREAVDTNDPVVTYTGFTGLRNTVSAEHLKPTEMVTAINVDLDSSGTLKRRAGSTQRAAVDAHSLWSNGTDTLYISNTTLNRFNTDYTSTVLAAGLSQGLRMRYVEVNGVVYHANGAEQGAYTNGRVRQWGIKAPVTQPQATAIPGMLPAGTYQYAVTFEAADLRESGTGIAGVIELADDQGISFTSIPVSSNSTVANVRLYLTAQNGDVLFYAASVTNGTTAYDFVGSVLVLGNVLRTQFMDRPTAMQELALWHGRIYGLQFGVLKYTEQMNYELMNPNNFIMLESAGKIIAPVESGVFVATETNTWFLRGDGPENFVRLNRASYGGIFGTLAYIEHENYGIVPMWQSTQGMVIGTDGGELKNITRSKYVYADAPVGASIFKQSSGLNQYISVLQG